MYLAPSKDLMSLRSKTVTITKQLHIRKIIKDYKSQHILDHRTYDITEFKSLSFICKIEN